MKQHADGTPCAGSSCAWRGDGGHAYKDAPRPADALKAMLDGLLRLDEALAHFTCREAELLADVYRANGRNDDADSIIESHAWGDDDADDVHHRRYLELHGEACPTPGCIVTDRWGVKHGEDHGHVFTTCSDGHREDDGRCKDCGGQLVWVGPNSNDWEVST